MTEYKLNQPADIGLLHQLYHEGLLNENAYKAASSTLRSPTCWFSWARQMLLILGSLLMLAGIIFFFAYNWSEMGKFLKFSLIEAGILICAIASCLRKRTELSSKVLLLSGSILVGVLLAVYGQIYQTGADAYGLFLGWAVLITGWVIISEFAALWIVWLLLINTGTILYWLQVGEPAHAIRFEYLCLTVAVLNGTALALREWGIFQGREWLSGGWLRGILLVATLVPLSLPANRLIVDFNGSEIVTGLAASIWVIVIVCVYACYRFRLHDMSALALIAMNICEMLLTFTGKLIFEITDFGDASPYLLFALVILGVVSGSVFWLQNTAATMADERKELVA